MAGVSKTTVSLVLNEKSRANRISPDTEKRICDIVRKTGYLPNKVARGFRLNRSQTIGLVVPDLINPFFSELNYALEQRARQNGYQLLISCSEDDRDIEQAVVNNLLSYSIEGLIVASILNEEQLLKKTYSRKIPIVFVDREIALKNVSSVSSDNYQGAFDAVQILCSEGVREVAYIGGMPGLSTNRNRLNGYAKALQANRLPVNPQMILQENYRPADGYNMIKKIHGIQGRFPESIFTFAFTVLEGVLQFVKETCGSIPPSLKIATFDDHPLLDYIPNKTISVKQDCVELARNAFVLFEKAKQGHSRARHIRVKPTLIVRR